MAPRGGRGVGPEPAPVPSWCFKVGFHLRSERECPLAPSARRAVGKEWSSKFLLSAFSPCLTTSATLSRHVLGL